MRDRSDEDLAETLGAGPGDTQIAYKLRLAQIAAYRAFEERVTGFGKAPRYLGLLMIIRENPGSNQSSLAEAVGLRRSSLVAILDQLERDRIVRRDAVPGDRRSKAVRLTGYGERLLAELTEEAEAHEAALTAGISEADLAVIRAGLDRIILNMRAADQAEPGVAAAASSGRGRDTDGPAR